MVTKTRKFAFIYAETFKPCMTIIFEHPSYVIAEGIQLIFNFKNTYQGATKNEFDTTISVETLQYMLFICIFEINALLLCNYKRATCWY